MDEPRQVGEAIDFRRPLHQRARDGRQIRPQDRFGSSEALLMLAGGDENGGARLLRVVEHPHRISEPRRDVQIDHGELARGLGVAIGHGHHRCFLQPEQVAQLVFRGEGIHQRQFRSPGIAEHHLHAFLLEHVQESALTRHYRQSVLQWVTATRDAASACELRNRGTRCQSPR